MVGARLCAPPASYRFSTGEVYIRRDGQTEDLVLSPKPQSWGRFLLRLMLIAAHALAAWAIWLTNDKAFGQVAHLSLESWAGAYKILKSP